MNAQTMARGHRLIALLDREPCLVVHSSVDPEDGTLVIEVPESAGTEVERLVDLISWTRHLQEAECHDHDGQHVVEGYWFTRAVRLSTPVVARESVPA